MVTKGLADMNRMDVESQGDGYPLTPINAFWHHFDLSLSIDVATYTEGATHPTMTDGHDSKEYLSRLPRVHI